MDKPKESAIQTDKIEYQSNDLRLIGGSKQDYCGF